MLWCWEWLCTCSARLWRSPLGCTRSAAFIRGSHGSVPLRHRSPAWRSGSGGRRASVRSSPPCLPSRQRRIAWEKAPRYSLGLGIPFLITALAFGRLAGAFTWVKQHIQGITAFAGVSMSLFGVLLIFDRLTWVTSQLQNLLTAVGLERLIFLG